MYYFKPLKKIWILNGQLAVDMSLNKVCDVCVCVRWITVDTRNKVIEIVVIKEESTRDSVPKSISVSNPLLINAFGLENKA